MKVHIACEESQQVCTAFRERGHEAYSCDIQHCALYNHMEWHIVEKAEKIINGDQEFMTVDGTLHIISGPWDLLIAHPPCTYLTAASAVRLYDHEHNIKNQERYRKGILAAELFMLFYQAECEKVCIENPVPMHIWGLPEYTQIIEPYMFGDPWKKRTCLWLKNLPELKPTKIVVPKGLWVGVTSIKKDQFIKERYSLNSIRDPKRRSKTFRGIAQAMAEQWGRSEDDGTV